MGDGSADENAGATGGYHTGVGDTAVKGRDRHEHAGRGEGAMRPDKNSAAGGDRAVIDDATGEGRNFRKATGEAGAEIDAEVESNAGATRRDRAVVNDAAGKGRYRHTGANVGRALGKSADVYTLSGGGDASGIEDAAGEQRD